MTIPTTLSARRGQWLCAGKITGDDTGWRLVRDDGELRLAAE